MKRIFFALLSVSIALSSCGPTYVAVSNPPPPPPQQEPVQEEVSYQAFYDDLSPYGQWVDYPGYGYVWMPNVGPDFKPYATNGHWVYSDQGWVWASDYNWGWATFHYGRWFFDQGYGWIWVPGNEWAPAWVSWRRSPDYYGWAPMSPNVSASVSISSYNPPPNYWCFVPHQYVNSPNVNNYYVNEQRNVTIINNTTVINNTVINNNVTNNRVTNNTTINNNTRNNIYVAGPDANEVSRATGTAVRPMVIRTSNRPGQTQINNNQINIFRPRVSASPTTPTATTGNNAQQQRVAPARVQPLSNVRPMMNINNNNTPVNNGNVQPPNRVDNRNNTPSQPVNNNAPQLRPVNNNEPVINRPVTTPPVNNNQLPVQNTRPANNEPVINRPVQAPVNNSPSVPIQNSRPVNTPNNNQPAPRPTTPAVVNPVNNNANNPAQNQNPRIRNQQPVPVNNPNTPATANPNRPAVQNNRLSQRPLPPNQQQVQPRRPVVTPKPAVVNKDDKKDKPPAQQ